MRIHFPTGEIFDGPWTDDDSVSDQGVAYRRLVAAWVTPLPEGGFRINSGAFPPHRLSLSISVTLGAVATELGRDVRRLALFGHEQTHGLATFNVGEARSLGFKVRRVPVASDPAHGILFAKNDNTGMCPDKSRCRSLGRKLSRLASILVLPPPVL